MQHEPRVPRRIAAALVFAFALSGCGSDDNDVTGGGNGTANPPGVPTALDAESLDVAITGITLASQTVLDFSAKNQDGVRFAGLLPGNLRFGIAQLVPGENGAPDRWQSYISRTETPPAPGASPNDWPYTTAQTQATTDSGGTLVNNKDGSYRYTFGSNNTGINPALTHRLLLRISGTDSGGGALPLTNVTYDWQPSTGATTGLRQREIVQTASCNECHTQLAMHGGGYREVKACVVCHNPGSTDANSGNTLDFKVLAHKIHQGRNLPSVKAGGAYNIWGYNNTKFEFGKIGYPQDIRNCSKCHDAADTATPQGGNWEQLPSREACGACHDDVNFETGAGHGASNLPAANGQCTTCHNDVAAPGVARAHQRPLLAEAAQYQFTIINVTLNPDASGATAGFPVVTYKVTDPTRDDAPYDLVSDADPADTPWAGGLIASRLRLDIGWGAGDYRNQDNADTSGRPADALWLNGLVARSGYNATPVDNGDGSYTVTSLVGVPLNAGTMAVAMEGHPRATTPDTFGAAPEHVPVKSVVSYVPTSAGAVATPRREVVDIASCNQCHDQLSLHGNSRTDEPQLCVICHNANNTDIAWRPANPADTPDGKKEQALDFKVMIHGIHAADFREQPLSVYAIHGIANNYYPDEAKFPGILANCGACHKASTFTVPLASGVLGTTIDSGADRTGSGDDLNITATAAACSSCHADANAATHMGSQGASFNQTESAATFETCEFCHGPGRMLDVATVHKLQPVSVSPAALSSPAHEPANPASWYPWCKQCHDPAKLAPPRVVESARTWMRTVGTGYGQWITRGSHGEADMNHCFDCHKPQFKSDGAMPCNFCHSYQGQAQKHQWTQKFAYPPGVDPTKAEDCAVACHVWVNGEVVSPGFTNSSGDPEMTTYRGEIRPGYLMTHTDNATAHRVGDDLQLHPGFNTGGCANCHNREEDKSWHGRKPVDPLNLDGAYTTTVPNCVDCHNFSFSETTELNLHSTHATLVGAEMKCAYPEGYDSGMQACALCHADRGTPPKPVAACWNCHLSGHWPEVPYWKMDTSDPSTCSTTPVPAP